MLSNENVYKTHDGNRDFLATDCSFGVLSETSNLSLEEKERANLVGKIIDILSEGGKKEIDWGPTFDRFYEKSLTELRMLPGLYKKKPDGTTE